METIFKVEEVAKILNISISYLYKKAEAGAIGSIKIGSALRFSKKNITDYLEKCSREPVISETKSK